MKVRLAFFVLTFLCNAPAFAQTQSDPGRIVPASPPAEAKYAPLTSEWSPVTKNAPPDAVIELLKKEGWPQQEVQAAIAKSESYNVYRQVISPGVGSYLAVPVQGKSAPVQFGAGIPGLNEKLVRAGWIGFGPSDEDIRKQIMEGIQATIEALCSMPARPSQIRAQASALGIIEFEATWQSGEVCK